MEVGSDYASVGDLTPGLDYAVSVFAEDDSGATSGPVSMQFYGTVQTVTTPADASTVRPGGHVTVDGVLTTTGDGQPDPDQNVSLIPASSAGRYVVGTHRTATAGR